jgi:hypothetical protein
MVAAMRPQGPVTVVDPKEDLHAGPERRPSAREERAVARSAELDRCNRGGEERTDVLDADRSTELSIGGLGRRGSRLLTASCEHRAGGAKRDQGAQGRARRDISAAGTSTLSSVGRHVRDSSGSTPGA